MWQRSLDKGLLNLILLLLLCLWGLSAGLHQLQPPASPGCPHLGAVVGPLRMLPVDAAHQHAAQAAAQRRVHPAISRLAEAEGHGQLHVAACAAHGWQSGRPEAWAGGEGMLHDMIKGRVPLPSASKRTSSSEAAAPEADISYDSRLASVLK